MVTKVFPIRRTEPAVLAEGPLRCDEIAGERKEIKPLRVCLAAIRDAVLDVARSDLATRIEDHDQSRRAISQARSLASAESSTITRSRWGSASVGCHRQPADTVRPTDHHLFSDMIFDR